uniref:NTF2 domain-containing protein n=1 Tax=Strongyloides stercoralis TaxID=6248 RepID=A0A0K0E4Q4_STRER
MAKRIDVKNQSKSNFSRFDADIVSAYVEEDNNNSTSLEQNKHRLKNKYSHSLGKTYSENKLKWESFVKGGSISTKQKMFLVVVKGCDQCRTDEIITVLQGYTPPFVPYLPGKTTNGDVKFYINDTNISTNLKQLTRRVKNPMTKRNIIIIVTEATCPWNKLPTDHKKAIELACKSRLSNDKKTLDLSNFTSDSYFQKENISISLQRAEVMNVVVDFVYKECPEATSLSLKNTELKQLDSVASLTYAMPLIKNLDISCNMINDFSELARIRIWKLEKLFLNGSDGGDVSKTFPYYSRVIQGYFPYLTTLDGTSLLSNDENFFVKDENNIKIQPGFSSSPLVEEALKNFITQYFNLFDGPDGLTTRKQLEKVYDENATFSLICDIINDGNNERAKENKKKLYGPPYSIYKNISNDILFKRRIGFSNEDSCKKSNLEVIETLCKLPLTKHDKESFVIDCFLTTDKVVSFTIQGIFNDGKGCFNSPKLANNLKYFTRSFVCLPKGRADLSIISDVLSIYPINIECIIRYEEYCMKLKKQQFSTDISTKINDLSTCLENTTTSPTDIDNLEFLNEIA